MRYLKMVPPILGVLIAALISAFSDGKITTVEALQILVVVLQAAGVGLAGSLPAGLLWPKTAVAAVLAGFQVLLTYMTASGHLGSVTLSEWLNVVLAIAVAAGVAIIPPRSAVNPPPATP